MSESPVTVTIEDKIALISLDDGRANALSHAVLDALGAAFDRAEREALAVVVSASLLRSTRRRIIRTTPTLRRSPSSISSADQKSARKA